MDVALAEISFSLFFFALFFGSIAQQSGKIRYTSVCHCLVSAQHSCCSWCRNLTRPNYSYPTTTPQRAFDFVAHSRNLFGLLLPKAKSVLIGAINEFQSQLDFPNH